nr:hypothetical protein [Tanacetum cinerariifolium]
MINILDFCEEYYEDILPVMDKIRRDKRREVHTRLDFGENSRKSRRIREDSQNSSVKTLSARYRNPPESPQIRDRLRNNDGNMFGRLGHRRESTFKRLSETCSPSTTKSGPDRKYSRDDSYGRGRPHKQNSSPSRDRPRNRGRSHDIEESYGNTCSYRTRDKHRYHSHGIRRSSSMKKGRNSKSPLSRVAESSTSERGHWKSKSKRRKPTDEEDLAVPWSFEEVEHWAMPVWYHMFNSTLIGTARVWLDELPPKSIDRYTDLKAAFLAYFMQQKKYVKDPGEIHNIKQKDGETIEEFMKRFKIETGRMKGAPQCMRISGFMHGVNNPELIKRHNEHDQPKRQNSKRRSDFRSQLRDGRGSNKFTPLTRTPKEILTAELGKFKLPPPMVPPVEKRSSNKFCEFHNDKGHNTDECVQLRKQIEELVRAGKLSHFIKEIKRDRDQQMTGQKEAPVKDKAATIYMIQPWQRTEAPRWRGRKALYKSMDEFYDSEVTITVQRHHRKAWDKINLSSTIHGSRNAQILEDYYWRNGINKSTNEIMHTLKEKLRYIRMEAVRHDWSTTIDCETPTQYSRRILSRQTEKQGQAPERAKAIQVEVQKLVEAGILREVYYHDWLSNPFMCGFDDRKRHSPDTSLFCEPSTTDSRAKLYSNGKASLDASLRSQEAAQILSGASHRGHHRPTHQAGFLVEKPYDALPEESVIKTP